MYAAINIATTCRVSAIAELLHQRTHAIGGFLCLLDHLDMHGHFQSLFSEFADPQAPEAANACIYRGCHEARSALGGDWKRAINLSSPGYQRLPENFKKALAGAALTY